MNITGEVPIIWCISPEVGGIFNGIWEEVSSGGILKFNKEKDIVIYYSLLPKLLIFRNFNALIILYFTNFRFYFGNFGENFCNILFFLTRINNF